MPHKEIVVKCVGIFARPSGFKSARDLAWSRMYKEGLYHLCSDCYEMLSAQALVPPYRQESQLLPRPVLSTETPQPWPTSFSSTWRPAQVLTRGQALG